MKYYLSKYLLVWLVLTCLVAFFWPNLFGTGVGDPFVAMKNGMQILIAVTMLAIGSLLPVEEVVLVARRWKTVFGGTMIQFFSMPLLAFLAANLFQLEGPYYLGLIIVGSVPGAMASNMLTMISKGNVSYSVGLTTSATLLSPVVVPVVLFLLVGTRVSIDFWSVAETLFLTVVCPVVIGFLLAQRFRFWQRLAENIAEIAANIAIILIIASVVAQNRGTLSGLSFCLFGALLTLNLLGYLSGYYGGRMIGLDERMRRALLLEVGMQNAGLGTMLATKYFPDQPKAALCCALYTFGCMFTGILIAKWFSVRKIAEDRSTVSL